MVQIPDIKIVRHQTDIQNLKSAYSQGRLMLNRLETLEPGVPSENRSYQSWQKLFQYKNSLFGF